MDVHNYIFLVTNDPKFTVNDDINRKIFIVNCELLEIDTGSIVVFLDEVNKFSSKIVRQIQIRKFQYKLLPYVI